MPFAGLVSVVNLFLMFSLAGQNCIHLASVQGFLSLVENMVDLGADINAKVHTTYLYVRMHSLYIV